MASTAGPSPTPTVDDNQLELKAKDEKEIAAMSKFRKSILLIAFSFAQFLDVLNISAIFTGIPDIALKLDMAPNESVWLLSAVQLTFASFLLLSGRLADLYNTKLIFISGFFSMGVISIGAGFINNKIGLIVLRAFQGVAAATTIPSALHLIIHLFPKPGEQAMAVGLFGGSGALANVLGIIIGALFVQFATWRWIFWFNAAVAIPISLLCILLIPNAAAREDEHEEKPRYTKFQRLDIIGVADLTIAFILFIFAITSASTEGWGSARVLAPLIVSLFLIVAFFIYEARIPEQRAALPPKIWYYTNFSVLFGLALLPFFWWSTLYLVYMPLWQGIYHWSAVGSAVRMLPLGIVAVPLTVISASLQKKVRLKTLIVTGLILLIPGTILLPFGDRKGRFWPVIFPALIFGTAGATLVFTNTNIGFFKFTPPSVAGTVGAAFNSALQLGAAIGLAVVTTIETNVADSPDSYNGRAAGFWFLLAVVVVELGAALIFFREEWKEESAGSPEKAADTAASASEANTVAQKDEKVDLSPRGEGSS